MDNRDQHLHCASIEWQDGVPVSQQFDDVYYNRTNGLQETDFVFLQHNKLAERWTQLGDSGGHFSIGETGFGSGLNFLAASELWLRTAPDNWRLHFISAELFPLSPADLEKALSGWPQLAPLAEQLKQNYPPTVAGAHRLVLFEGRVVLTLLFGEAAQMFSAIASTPEVAPGESTTPKFDAWFLDGFAPAKNPGMWTDLLFSTIANLSRSNTTFATFTAAGTVRRGLVEAGFKVEKASGFGHKREMLYGSFERTHPAGQKLSELRWYINATPRSDSKEVVVIGAGIAGCCTAVALKKRGLEVTVVDHHAVAGQGGSGNPQGIVYPKLSPRNDYLPRINLASLLFAQRYYQPYWQQGLGEKCGVLVLPEDAKSATDFSAIAARFSSAPGLVELQNNNQLRQTSGMPLQSDCGLFFPGLGWLPPAQLCQQLLRDHDIPIIQASVDSIELHQGWALKDQNQKTLLHTKQLILAAANGVAGFAETRALPLRSIRGQISLLPSTEASSPLKTVLCGQGYLTPTANGSHSCGATYNRDNPSTALTEADHQTNLRQLANTDAALGEIWPQSRYKGLDGRANFRCTTPDYLPLVGPVADTAAMLENYAFLKRDARKISADCGNYLPNLYLHCGLGSRGLSYAPLMAELLAAEICGELAPLERELRLAVHPARFIIRDLKRNRTNAYSTSG